MIQFITQVVMFRFSFQYSIISFIFSVIKLTKIRKGDKKVSVKIILGWIDPTAHNDGREARLLALDGTLPVVIRGETCCCMFNWYRDLYKYINNY